MSSRRFGTVVLTGATSGIGRATAVALAPSCDHLVLHGLEPRSAVEEVLDQVGAALRPGARLDYLDADFGSLASVAALAEGILARADAVDVLVNNAARPGPPSRTENDAGVEVTLQTNFLAPVALTTALLPALGRGGGRVVSVASATHLSATLHLDDLGLARHPYSGTTAYAHSKLALVTWSCWLAAHRPVPTLEVVSLHPGVIRTGLLHAMFSITGAPPSEAAATVAAVVARRGDNGTYYDESRPSSPHPDALDPDLQDRLVAATARLLAVPAA